MPPNRSAGIHTDCRAFDITTMPKTTYVYTPPTFTSAPSQKAA